MSGEVVDYGIGLDLGNGSVGWAVINDRYRLLRARGKELIGARLFNPANSAVERRGYRTTRRRISRRRWRLRMLDGIFASHLYALDPNFLTRRKYSWVHPLDGANHKNWYGGILFDSIEQDKEFYRKYPTIYHLRKALMEDGEKHDLREVYMAIHHIIKYRGNFLYEGDIKVDKLITNEDILEVINTVLRIAFHVVDDTQLCSLIEGTDFISAINNTQINRTKRAEDAEKTLKPESAVEVKSYNTKIKALLKAIVGNNVNLADLFAMEDVSSDQKKALTVKFNDANFDDKYQKVLDTGLLDDDMIDAFAEVEKVYQALLLKQMLQDETSISRAKVASYLTHKDNWQFVKDNLRNSDDKADVNSHYLGLMSSNETLQKSGKEYFEKLIKSASIAEEIKVKMLLDLENGTFVPVQRSTDNGVIPHQLHLNELHKIIESQGKYYPFLLETYTNSDSQGNKIEALLKFRIPYFVGPLVTAEEMANRPDNSKYHWMVRKDDGRNVITPWNFDDVVDKDESGRRFIQRLTGTDTYLLGEPTLPAHSLLYEEYTVLSELNNVRMSIRMGHKSSDSRRERLTTKQKDYLIENLFKTRKTVTKKKAEECLKQLGDGEVTLYGLADETKFVSSMSSYQNLKAVLGKDFVDDTRNAELLEKIVEIQTVFEDNATRRHQLSLLEELNTEQLEVLSRIHYSGWGRLSKKLLTAKSGHMKLHSLGEYMAIEHSIIDIMRAESLNLTEIIRDQSNGVQEWIDKQNLGKDDYDDLDSLIADLPASPRVKRGVYQAIRVIDDIARGVGNPPHRIFIEMADEVEATGRTSSRKKRLDDLYKSASLGKEFDDISSALEGENNDSLSDDRLYLYYLQLGKDMYTGKPIDIAQIHSHYDIDHIIPQAVTKDDSIDNRVLVSRVENARKSDSFLYTDELVKSRYGLWSMLHEQKLISDKKFNALTRNHDFTAQQKARFTQRSLVETRQIMKNVSTVLRSYCGENISVTSINSDITHDMRRYLGYEHKNRDINDYHHAQDAMCVAVAGQFMTNRGFVAHGQVTDGAGNAYNRYLDDFIRSKREERKALMEESPEKFKSAKVRAFGFVVGSMRSDDDMKKVNTTTGEVVWSEEDKDYVRKVMGYRKMLITKKVGDTKTSALYKETRMSHHKATAKYIPFDKERSDTSLYGGFIEASTAHMVLVWHKRKVRLVSITAQESSLLVNSNDKTEILSRLLAEKGYPSAVILLDYVAIEQLFKCNNALLRIKSGSEFNTAWQMCLPYEEYNLFDILVKAKSEEKAEVVLRRYYSMTESEHILPPLQSIVERLYVDIFEVIEKYYPLHRFTEEKKREIIEVSRTLDFAQNQTGLLELVKALHANAYTASFAPFKLDRWYRISRPLSISDDDEFIFQSPAGIFESRVTVRELKVRAGITE